MSSIFLLKTLSKPRIFAAPLQLQLRWIASILHCKNGGESLNHLSFFGSDALTSNFFSPS